MRQYFTYRPIILNGIYTPQYAFDNELNSVQGLSYQFVCQKQGDNRHLAYFEYNGDLTNIQISEIVGEVLLKYSYHPKIIEKARDFILECIPNIDIIEIIGDKIVFTTTNNLP